MVHRQKILPYFGWIGYVCQVLSPRWLKILFHFWQFWVPFISQNHNQAVELVELFFPLSYSSNIGCIIKVGRYSVGIHRIPKINDNEWKQFTDDAILNGNIKNKTSNEYLVSLETLHEVVIIRNGKKKNIQRSWISANSQKIETFNQKFFWNYAWILDGKSWIAAYFRENISILGQKNFTGI